MSDWLYPLSKTAVDANGNPFRFLVAGRWAETSYENFVALYGEGHRTDDWLLAQLVDDVELDDTVWVYQTVANGDWGVTAKAYVERVDRNTANGDIVRLEWDRQATDALIVTPFPGEQVRFAVEKQGPKRYQRKRAMVPLDLWPLFVGALEQHVLWAQYCLARTPASSVTVPPKTKRLRLRKRPAAAPLGLVVAS